MCGEEIVVLLDFQSVFQAAADKQTTEAVLVELKSAMQRHLPIAIVEFVHAEVDLGETLPCVRELLSGYDKLCTVSKDTSDGAWQLYTRCQELGWIAGNLRNNWRLLMNASRRKAASDQSNKSAAASALMMEESDQTARFRIFGVDADVCLRKTTESLCRDFGAHVTVVKAASNSHRKNPWAGYADLPNLRLV